MKKDFEKYTWSLFEKDCEKIATWARVRKFKNIYGIPRGGLILAVKLSHLLNLPIVLDKKDINKKTLIVDDIIDGGDTIERLFSFLGRGKKITIASIFYNHSSKIKPDFFVREKIKWVIFPWETNKSSKYDGTLK